MSVYPTAWVLKNSPERLANRLVLLLLADRANDDGTGSWPSVETIARETRLSRRAVQTSLRGLEASGAIFNRGPHPRHSTTVYDVYMGGAESAPPPVGGANDDTQGAQTTTSRGADFAPEPSLVQPSFDPSSQDVRASESTGLVLGGQRRSWKVDRKPVTDDEYGAARAILDAWNRVADQRLASTDWLAKIVMRLREHPDLTHGDHVEIITANLAHPWWTGAATPSVVYGSGAQFERSILAVSTGRTAGAAGAFDVAARALQTQREEQR